MGSWQNSLFSRVRKTSARQFSALEVHNFRMLFLGQVISLTGTWMQSVGLSWLALELTGSTVAIGLVTTVQFLPMMIFGLFGGVLADRLPRRKTLVIVQAAALVHAAFLGIIVLTGVVELWHVYVMAALAGLLSAIERPTRQSFLAELVGRERLPNAVGLHSSILNGLRETARNIHRGRRGDDCGLRRSRSAVDDGLSVSIFASYAAAEGYGRQWERGQYPGVSRHESREKPGRLVHR